MSRSAPPGAAAQHRVVITYGTLALTRRADDTAATGTFAPYGAYMVTRGQRRRRA
ncbi:hypothetical protein [Streptomyces sp. GS7]|uniref:hypothetical protein n=1 Tax=Streptomyces sp. GS7 TaxID=2692234 RepID=UPI00131933CD|nr:hypothetical protein [Streptomyces sp. GS7]QHC22671.1 hypothetical protein GR130_15750 [Streptomyces sp. GS7]